MKAKNNQKTSQDERKQDERSKRVIAQRRARNAGKSFLWACGILLGVIVGILLIRAGVSPRDVYLLGFGFTLALCYTEISGEDFFKEHPFSTIIICAFLCFFWMFGFLWSAYRYMKYLEEKHEANS